MANELLNRGSSKKNPLGAQSNSIRVTTYSTRIMHGLFGSDAPLPPVVAFALWHPLMASVSTS